MKKAILLTIALLFSTMMFAQNRAILLNETFDSTSLPEGWTTSETGADNWVISQTNNAGGSANELCLSWWPILTGSSRVITKPIDLSGINEVVVNFKHYLDNQINEYTLGIATSSDNGSTWNVGWSETFGTTGSYEVYQLISTPDMGKENVLFSIFYEGASYTMNGWYFDDFKISTQDNLDLEIVSIDVPEMINYGYNEISFTVQNMGATTIETIEATFKDFFNDEAVISQTFNVNIESLDTYKLTFTENIFLSPGTYVMPIEIVSVNGTSDINEDNNYMEKDLNVGMGYTQKIPMIEHFSSSTCGPCVNANAMMLEITNANPGRYTYTKYPVNFPGIGDPYYFNEVAGRAGYYQVDAVPMLYLDGIWQEYTIVTQEALDASYETPSVANVRGAFNVEGNVINITADFMSYIKMENVRAFVTVNEKVTTGNVGSNGETEFRHIFMKALDSPTGNVMNINAGEYQRLEFTYDMSSTNVEEMNDLEVSLWLQNYVTGEIYNSHFAYEYTDHCYPVRNMMAGISDDLSTLSLQWETPEQGTPTGYDIYIDGELIKENHTGLSYSTTDFNEDVLDGKTHIAEVVAVYENEMTSVGALNIIISNWVNINEKEEISLSIYPNPAKDFVKIKAHSSDFKTVKIYNYLGILINVIEANSDEIEINTSDYNTGIYIIDIQTENDKITKKIIVK